MHLNIHFIPVSFDIFMFLMCVYVRKCIRVHQFQFLFLFIRNIPFRCHSINEEIGRRKRRSIVVKSQWSNLNSNDIQIMETKNCCEAWMLLDACQFYGYFRCCCCYRCVAWWRYHYYFLYFLFHWYGWSTMVAYMWQKMNSISRRTTKWIFKMKKKTEKYARERMEAKKHERILSKRI